MIRLLPGPTALSAFRIQKLLEELATAGVTVRSLDTQFVHFVDLTETLDEAQETVLLGLLRYGSDAEQRDSLLSEGTIRLVVPRSGTISPWSSKSTDIARICGLSSVNRIERPRMGVTPSTGNSSENLAAEARDSTTMHLRPYATRVNRWKSTNHLH